jgi:excisionase family DNA binding protein
MENLLTVPEAAQMLRMSEHSIYLWLRSGKLKSVRPGRKWLIPKEEIDRLLSTDGHNE